MARSVVGALGGGEASEWEWPNAMRALGRVLGGRPSLRKLAIQHTAARALVLTISSARARRRRRTSRRY